MKRALQRQRAIEILLVEDSPTDRLVTVTAIEQSGIHHSLHVVDNGVDAMAFLRRQGRFEAAPRPDLLLLDLNMPKMDGREVLSQIKRDPLLRFIPVVVLTTSSAEEDITWAYGEHANSYITKPVDFTRFSAALETLGKYWFEVVTLPPASAFEGIVAPSAPTRRATASLEPLHVLLIEDSETDALLVRTALECSQGRQFRLSHTTRLSDAEQIIADGVAVDVVLTDLGLPDSRGVATYRRIQAAARGVPVIVLTNFDDEATGLEALREGAHDYLLKGELTGRALQRAVRYAIDRKAIQSQLLQSQRLEAVGQLAGGVAHDFNNLLTIIQANASFLESSSDPRDIAECAMEISAAAERGAMLTRQLLAFSRTQVLEANPIDLNNVVASTSQMLRRVIGDVNVELRLGSELPPILGDVGMIEQVLINLAVNARDAMPGGGRLTLGTRYERLTPSSARTLDGQAYAGEFVVLDVQDTGDGIEPGVLDQIWDPFFTTKASGVGTGIGLTTVYGIVQQHRGWIRVHSKIDDGTSFEVYLPVSSRQLTEANGAGASPASDTSTGAGKTVLVVDDERAIRASVTRVLAANGFSVIEADSGEKALRVWERRGDAIDVVLADLTIPDGMGGRELADRLRARSADVRIVFSSGYSADAMLVELQLRRGVTFLQKPYSAAQLLDIVNAACGLDSDD
ncbi:sensory box histidine kinase/response regulator [Enhygromyxa salina]|uniref:histidine kinase n=1 Tax=Enhygromyxa salina TaxID=215803 RepID=A0A0C2D656_9BACT|nr:response regulator [Enhygromyxa salina]KIG15527.1 sensory box histidine kinase/response regulator [Enhygromyxa salina]